MPLVAQATGQQAQRISARNRLGHRLVGSDMEARAAIGGGEHAITVAPRLALLRPPETAIAAVLAFPARA